MSTELVDRWVGTLQVAARDPQWLAATERAARQALLMSIYDWTKTLGSARLAVRALAGESLVCLISEDLEIDRDDWLWDAVSLFEKHPDAVMVGGRIRNRRGEIISAGLVLGFEDAAGCPDAGRPAIDPGYFAQMWKQRSVSAVSSQFAVIRASFLRELPADASIPFLGAWAGAAALRLGKRIVYSPFLSAVSNLDWNALVTDQERNAFRTAHRDILPDYRYYSRYLGLSRESAYKPV